MSKKRLLVISIDSMVTEDLSILQKLPHFKMLLDDASVILRNEATYPTFTHSIHTAIATGCYPGTHGVNGNEYFQPGNLKPEWFDKASDVKVPMIQTLAKQHGYSVACIYWPLSQGAPLDWILYRKAYHTPYDREQQQVRERSTPGLFEELYPYIKDTFTMDTVYGSDQLCGNACAYMIDTYRPEVMYTHLISIDTIRHHHGVFGEHILKTYEFLDGVIGQMIDALKRQNLWDTTIVNVTADHGHMDIRRVVSVNRFFKDHGLITTDEAGRMTDWKAYLHSCALSGHIYVKDNDPAVARQTLQLLADNKRELDIETIFTHAEVKEKYHLDGGFAYVIESNGAAAFSADYNAPLRVESGGKDYRYAVSTHGHEPWKGVQPAFFIRDPYAKKRLVLANGRIIDQAPTLAKMLGFAMPQADGVPREELL